jgi:undecaprenyl diphosphate synthase
MSDVIRTSSRPEEELPRDDAERSPGGVPRHVAIIMDGNGRWAQDRGKPRTAGHEHGALATRRIVAEGRRLGIEVMTLYSFSVENWRRPETEVGFLMELFSRQLAAELPDLIANGIRLVHVGRRQGLPQRVLDDLDDAVARSAGQTGMTLALAWNYSGRSEIADAAKSIARDAAAGRLNPDDIDESTVAAHLYTAGLPDPDLLIRTAGEMRLSNFLLWQISYAELWITSTLWPDFSEEEFRHALADYASRQRKFGGVG